MATCTLASLFCDGSSLNNPGPSGMAYIIRYYEDNKEGTPEPVEIEFKQGYRVSTNNRMEIMAALCGLQKIMELIEDGTLSEVRQINVASDSEYLCKAINQSWIYKWQTNNWMTAGYGNKKPARVKNQDLWEQMLDLQTDLKKKNVVVIMNYIKGHAGHEFNERCDRMAVQAANGSEHLIDEGYEKRRQV